MVTEAAGDSKGEKGDHGPVERRKGQSIRFTASSAPEEEKAAKARAWLEALASRVPGVGGYIEGVALWGMRVDRIGGGTVVCSFQSVPPHLADAEGIWTPGSIATVIDIVGAVAIASLVGEIKVSVAFDISYFAPAKVEEEVEIEAKVSYHGGQVTAVTVDVRKKRSQQPVACGRQWMTSFPAPKHFVRNERSKL